MSTWGGTREDQPMNLEQALKEEQTNRKPRLFRVLEIAEQLDEKDRKAFLDALHNKTVKPPWIIRALQKQGITLSENAIRNYREAKNVI
jgi:hypothetical protein